MFRNSAIPPESFDEMLSWLNPDRDVAARVYVQLRADLKKIFEWGRCPDPEGLTDEVLDRVAQKVHELRLNFNGDPRLFFYGVARNLIKEESKKTKTQISLEGTDVPAQQAGEVNNERWLLREECLERCLKELSDDKRELIVSYYNRDKQAKIDHRAAMTKRLGLTAEALRTRVHRIRAELAQCIQRCLDANEDSK